MEPENQTVHRLRGAVLMELGRYTEALRSFDVCLSRGKPTASLYEARGLAQSWRGDFEGAISDFSLALRLGRDTSAVRTNLGWAFLFSGAARPALREFSEALRRDPSSVDALGGRGLARAVVQQTREALADAQELSARADGNARLTYNAARIFAQAATNLQAAIGQLSDHDFNLLKQCRGRAVSLIDRRWGRPRLRSARGSGAKSWEWTPSSPRSASGPSSARWSPDSDAWPWTFLPSEQ